MRRPQAKFQSSEPVVARVGRILLEARYTPVGSVAQWSSPGTL